MWLLGVVVVSPSNHMVEVVVVRDAEQVSVGHQHSCAVLTSGKVACWGRNIDGELGDGTNTSTTVPVTVPNLTNVTQVSAGEYFTCATKADGSVWCWGFGTDGQLGDGNSANSNVPVQVVGIANATQVATGGYHACARQSDGRVSCWGRGTSGQLGADDNLSSPTPVVAFNLTDALQVTAGALFSCARRSGGKVSCWGSGQYGQLGDGTFASKNRPTEIPAFSGAQDLSATSNTSYACAAMTDGTVQCWGYNSHGQLGRGNKGVHSPTPGAVMNATDVVQVSAGWVHACAVKSDGNGLCWGTNGSGRLGNDGVGAESLIATDVFWPQL